MTAVQVCSGQSLCATLAVLPVAAEPDAALLAVAPDRPVLPFAVCSYAKKKKQYNLSTLLSISTKAIRILCSL